MTNDMMLLARSVQLVGLFLVEVRFLKSEDLAQIMDIYFLMGPLGHGLGLLMVFIGSVCSYCARDGSGPNRIRFDLAQLLGE